ncbi:MAG: hypothetical protein AAGJ79_01000 [Verrucomicrobiota bacterium]
MNSKEKQESKAALRQHLAGFRRRRRLLLLIRAICVIAVLLLVGMASVALLDRLVIVPDLLRYCLSGFVYFAGVAMLLKEALIPLLIGLRDDEVASLVEAADPQHREGLLSAIELERSETGTDSKEFRDLVKSNALSRLDETGVRALLPWGMIGRSMAVAVLVGLGVGALFFVPGLRFEKLMARAFLPGANIERPSAVTLSLMKPGVETGYVVAGEEVSIVGVSDSQSTRRMWVERQNDEGLAERFEMRRERSGQFSTDLEWKKGSNRLRLRSRSAITRYFEFLGAERPAVTGFTKTYRYPDYTRREAVTTEEEIGGELSAIEGSEAEVQFALNQEVDSIEVRLLRPGREEPEVIEVVDGVASIPITSEYGRYHVALKGNETGFENIYQPDFEIRAVPDLPPVVELSEPGASREVLPDERVLIVGSVGDDVGIDQVARAFRLDEGEWTEDLLLKPGDVLLESPLRMEWPLAPLWLKGGQVVSMKLVAVDLKGQRAESRTVRFEVAEEYLERERREWTEKERKFAVEMRGLFEQMDEFQRSMQEASEAAKRPQAERSSSDQQKLARSESAAAIARQLAEEATAEALDLMVEAPSSVERREAEAIAERLNSMKERLLDPAVDAARRQSRAPRNAEMDRRLTSAEAKARQAKEEVRRLNEAVSDLTAEDVAEMVAREAETFAARAEAQANSDAIDGDILAAEEEMLKDRGDNLLASVEDLTPFLRRNEQKKLEKDSEEVRSLLEQDGDPGEANPQKMKTAAKKLAGDLDRLQEQVEREAAKARKALFAQTPDVAGELEKLASAARAVAQKERQREGQNDPSMEELEALDREIASKREDLARNLDAMADEIRRRSEQAAIPESGREDSASLNEAAQAMEALEDRVREGRGSEVATTTAEELAALGEAIGNLETEATVQSLREAMEELRAMEEAAKTEGPELYSAAKSEIEEVRKQLQKNAPSEASRKLAQNLAQGSEAKRVDEEMRQRESKSSREARDLSRPMEAMEDDSKKLAEALQPVVEEAKQKIADLAPSIPEQMRNLAESMKDQEEELRNLAQAGPKGPGPEAALDLASELFGNRQESEEIQSALMAEANQQDMRDAVSRETARDADDALAQMQNFQVDRPATEFEEAMQSATGEAERRHRLQTAARAQEEMADALIDLAHHLEKAGEEGGEMADARSALRESESASGVSQTLTDDYTNAQEIAEMLDSAADDAASLMKALEEELARNEFMQSALESLAANTAATAAEMLEDAAAKEGELSEALPSGKTATPEQSSRQEVVRGEVSEAGESLARSGRHQERLGNFDSAEAMADAAQLTDAVAANEAQAAQQAMVQGSPSADDAGELLGVAGNAIEERADEAGELAREAMSAASETAIPFDPQAMQLAMALDALDRQMASDSSPGQEGAANEATQTALSRAMEEQEMGMTKSRSLGFPGQPGESDSPPQGEGQEPGTMPSMAEGERGADLEEFGEGVAGLVVDLDMAEGDGDWSKLPRKVAEDILTGRSQEVSPDYRFAIESYFKAIAEETNRE